MIRILLVLLTLGLSLAVRFPFDKDRQIIRGGVTTGPTEEAPGEWGGDAPLGGLKGIEEHNGEVLFDYPMNTTLPGSFPVQIQHYPQNAVYAKIQAANGSLPDSQHIRLYLSKQDSFTYRNSEDIEFDFIQLDFYDEYQGLLTTCKIFIDLDTESGSHRISHREQNQ